MKIEVCGKDCYSIFINRCYCGNINFNERDELVAFIKNYFIKMKRRLNLRGFYKIKVFPQEKIGVFLDVLKLDDVDSTCNLDLRIIVLNDDNIFFETDDYELIKNCNEKRFLDGMFYCLVDDSFDGLLEKVEWGRFIYGKEVVNLLSNGLNL